MSQAQYVALFATAKTQLATVTADVTTLMSDLLALEQTRVQLANAAGGGNGANEWLQNAVKQLTAGFVPLTVLGGPSIVTVFAPDPAIPRNFSMLGDVRPVGQIDPSLS